MSSVQRFCAVLTIATLCACMTFTCFAQQSNRLILINYQVDEQQHDYVARWQGKTLSVAAGQPKRVVIATLDWPPYIGSQQCQGGWLLHYMSAVLIEAGYNPEFRFLPWARAVRMVELGHADILAPEYEIEASAPSDVVIGDTRLQHLAMSVPFSHTPLHYFSAAKSQIKKSPTPDELPNYSVGVVRGYQNSPDVDKVLDSGKVVVQQAIDDAQNLDLLVNNRVNLIIGDPFVINTVAKRKGISTNLYSQLEPSIIEQQLYFALSKARPQWQTLQSDINTAIATLNSAQVDKQITAKIKQLCHQD
ncbi:transporter substrate-binding domain-containing protein [Pseudoalteromonas sp. YIC-468]